MIEILEIIEIAELNIINNFNVKIESITRFSIIVDTDVILTG